MKLNYTERSWAIEVCMQISTWASTVPGPIRSAGGEHGIRDAGGALFPDVVLFGDGANAIVIQGWELKFPDTPVNDANLLTNAERKAIALNLDSFVVWNVNESALYSLKNGNPELIQTWHLPSKVDRSNVSGAPWQDLLRRMLEDITEYITSGEIRLTTPLSTLESSTFAGFVSRHVSDTEASLINRIGIDATLRDAVNLWWAEHAHEHQHSAVRETEVLANEILTSWLSKVFLAHAIRRNSIDAQRIDEITAKTSVSEAQKIFASISGKCDFLNVFMPQLAESTISKLAWLDLIEINAILRNSRILDTDPATLQQLLNIPLAASRKFSGQFATPPIVASLMVALASLTTNGLVIDPCSGSGTIAKAAYTELRRLGSSSESATASVWASDKFYPPLRLTTLSLSSPENRSLVLNIFQHDVAILQPGQDICLINPDTGTPITKTIPFFDAVVSNLPFVKQELIDKLNPSLRAAVNATLAPHGISLAGKSDLFAYIPFALFNITKPGSRVVLLTSNSWTATEWGVAFIDALERFYRINCIVTSGNGRWFSDVKVATTILVLERRENVVAASSITDEKTAFAVLQERIEKLCPADDPQATSVIAARIKSGKSQDKILRTTSVPILTRRSITSAGLGLVALFADSRWAETVLPLLCPISGKFDVTRGVRRGWDELFFPTAPHAIESEYLVPVLRSPRTAGLIAQPKDVAFCCDKDIATLTKLGHDGALSWIAKFETSTNKMGKPLPDVLRKKNGIHWYQMDADAVADLVIPMNPNTRLFVSRLRTRSFVNQRLIALRAHASTDTGLCHALLNSAVGILIIEASGFGRGEGALDLRSDTVKKRMRMLDPARITPSDRKTILDTFQPLLQRELLDLPEELFKEDRLDFDEAVAKAFGFQDQLDAIRQAIRDLLAIRQQASIV